MAAAQAGDDGGVAAMPPTPAPTAAPLPVGMPAPAHAPVVLTRGEARLRQLCASITLGVVPLDVSTAEEVARRVLGNMVMSVEQQAEVLRSPALPRLLRAPLPYNSVNPGWPFLSLELMKPAAGAEVAAGAWDSLRGASIRSMQGTKPFTLLTGVSGVGKTKAAYDVGLRHAFMVMLRVVEHGTPTPPWSALFSFASAVCNSAVRNGDGLPPVVERIALKAALVVLLGAHLEWAVDVSEAAVSAECRGEFDAAARAQLVADDAAPATDGVIDAARRHAVLREVVLRAQRNGLVHYNVAVNFQRALVNLLATPGAIAENGTLQVAVADAVAYLHRIVARARGTLHLLTGYVAHWPQLQGRRERMPRRAWSRCGGRLRLPLMALRQAAYCASYITMPSCRQARTRR